MDIFNYIREQLLIEQEYIIEGKFTKFIKDPLKYGASRKAWKRGRKVHQKAGGAEGLFSEPTASKTTDSFGRAINVAARRTAQAAKRTAGTAAAGGAGIGALAYRKSSKKKKKKRG